MDVRRRRRELERSFLDRFSPFNFEEDVYSNESGCGRPILTVCMVLSCKGGSRQATLKNGTTCEFCPLVAPSPSSRRHTTSYELRRGPGLSCELEYCCDERDEQGDPLHGSSHLPQHQTQYVAGSSPSSPVADLTGTSHSIGDTSFRGVPAHVQQDPATLWDEIRFSYVPLIPHLWATPTDSPVPQ